MIAKPSLSHRQIIEGLHTHYGIEVTTLTPLLLGADMQASVYKAQTRHLKTYFVKVKCGHQHDIGATLLSSLHEERIEQVIPPLKTKQDQLTQPLHECTLIVYPFIENQNGFTQMLTDEQWMTLGKVLRKVHEFKVPQSIQNQIRREAYSPKWRDFVRTLDKRFEAKPSSDAIAKNLQIFMKDHKPEIERLVNTAERLSQSIQQKSNELVLCHGDIHGGNVLIDTHHSIYIVDWDAPVMAPKERDLMFIGGGVANVWNRPHEEELFYRGYGKTEIDMSILAYYRHERIVEDIAEYAEALLFSSAGGSSRSEMYQQFMDMFTPRGVVDIAFKTSDAI